MSLDCMIKMIQPTENDTAESDEGEGNVNAKEITIEMPANADKNTNINNTLT